MTNGELAFIALAEEKNFTRAAEKIFMSQQGLSDHIRRLEQEYDTIFFTRKPGVDLTDSGRAFYTMLLEKRAMENDIRRMIEDIDRGDSGEVRVGISSSRMRVFASGIVQRFHEEHPGVRMHIVSDVTFILMDMLAQGKLDFVIGVNPSSAKEFLVEPVFDDPLYLAVPDHIAKERSGDDDLADIRDYIDVPFIRDINAGVADSPIDHFLAQNNISLNNIVEINDYNEQAALCKRLDAAMFCSKSFAFFSGGEIMRKGLRVMKVKDLSYSVAICLISMRARVYPKCVTEFMETSRDYLRRFGSEHIQTVTPDIMSEST